MTGQGIVTHPEDAAEVERRNSAFQVELAPKSEMGDVLIRQMATLSVRMERGAKQEFAAVATRVRNASGRVLEFVSMKIIQKSGTSYAYGNTKLGRGYDATRSFLKENKDVKEEILAEIRAKLKDDSTLAMKSPSEGKDKDDGAAGEESRHDERQGAAVNQASFDIQLVLDEQDEFCGR